MIRLLLSWLDRRIDARIKAHREEETRRIAATALFIVGVAA